MKQTTHKRSPLAGRAVAAAAALLLGGGALVAVNVSASAGQDGGGSSGEARTPPARAQNASTIDCPEVVDRIPEVPPESRLVVDRELARLDSQVGAAYEQLVRERADGGSDPARVRDAVLGPLADQRSATIDRISGAIARWTQRPEGLGKLAPCRVVENDGGEGSVPPANGSGGGSESGDGSGFGFGSGSGGGFGGGQDGGAVGGPSLDDFADITRVAPNVREPRPQQAASTGTFTTECGVNENRKLNSDNVIAAPGVSNGAHHMHDYVGNQDTTAFSTDDSLAAGATSCENQQDRSTYYWPVLRLRNGQNERDANAPGGGRDGNVGEIQQPSEVTLRFRGSPVGEVVEMPRFLRIITGDAKALTNGDANANASWSCTGFEDRQLRDKYPLCPLGSRVVRTFTFQSCWDGQNTDSANHRTHVDFANEDGSCDEGFRAIPQLVQRVVYDLPPGLGFAVDSFPEQLHKPVTDHGDFINVFSERLMRKAVDCINGGENCR